MKTNTRCTKCGAVWRGATLNGPPNCVHGVSMRKHCCECPSFDMPGDPE